MLEVHLADFGDTHILLDAVGAFDRDRIPGFEIIVPGEFLRDDHAAVLQPDRRLMIRCQTQVQYILRLAGIKHIDVDCLLLLLEIDLGGVGSVRNDIFIIKVLLQLIHDRVHVAVVFKIDDIVMVEDAAELQIDDIGDRVLDPPADNEQCCTAGDADNGHDEAGFITDQVAGRDLGSKGEPAPDKRQIFKEDLLRALRRLGTQQLARHLF